MITSTLTSYAKHGMDKAYAVTTAPAASTAEGEGRATNEVVCREQWKHATTTLRMAT